MLGTQNNSFHRLLEKIDELIEKEVIQEEVIVQAGYTKYESKNMEIFDMIPRNELENYQKEASLIITHGGVGSIVSSLKQGKKVIAVPRKHEYGEHVNNHQQEIIKEFEEKGYIIGVSGVEELPKAWERLTTFKPKPYQAGNQKMLSLIEDFIDSQMTKEKK
jgi:UDP-N-acetylglucosamine transferase subunit ALG13